MAYTTIDKPENYFNTVTWTGDGSRPVSITGVGFQPDMVWAKNRSPDAFEHKLYDSSRGAGSDKELTPNEAYYEGESNADTYGYLSSFDSDGFSSTDSNYNAYFNKIGTTYVAWNWKVNAGSTSSNTNGSITSTVQVNTDAGFSIGTFTGTGSTATVGHGLGVKPDMLFLKSRNNPSGAAMYWMVAHVGLDDMAGTKNLFLDKDWTADTNATAWGNTAPTSSVFTVGTHAATNYSGNNMLFYAFTSVQGFSKFGKYVGNGSTTNGPFVYTGFKPAFVMIKATDAAKNWTIFDNERNFNGSMYFLYASTAAAEGESPSSGAHIDLLSNGFKIYDNWTLTNQSTVNYIYMAFAENPFVTSTGIPTTAR